MLILSYIDLSIVLFFLFTCLVIGLYKSAQIKTLKEFALGFKGVSVTVLVCAIFASSVGAGSTIGVVGKIYESGFLFVVRQLLAPIYWIILIRIIINNINLFKGCITLSEIMFKLYGMPGRWVIVLASIIRSLGAIASQALALSFVFSYFLGIEMAYGILIGYGIITIYSVLGGIRAVIHTEIFKFIVFFLIIPISYILVFSKSGGFEVFFHKLPESHLKIDLSTNNLSLLFSFVLYALIPGFYPAFIQRCLIAKDTAQLKQALKMIALISLPFAAALCLIAYKMKADYPNMSSDVVLFSFIGLLPSIMQGLMVSGLIAVIMSLAEAEINATSIILVNDFLLVLYPNLTNRVQLIAVRLSTVLLAISSLSVIRLSNDILNLVWLIANFWGPVVSVPMMAGFLGFKTNSKSFIISVTAAMLFTFLGRWIVGEFAIMSWSFGILGSLIGFFGTHYYQLINRKIGRAELSLNIKDLIFTNSKNKFLELIKNFSKFFQSILHLVLKGTDQHKLEIRKFCTFTLSYYFLYSLYITSSPGHTIFAYLIIIGYFACMALLFREFIASKRFIEKYLHYYWYFLITFCLPFVSSYMLFIGFNDPFWVINGILSAFSLYLFVDTRRFILFYSIGVICAFILFRQSGDDFESFQGIATASRIAYIYLFFLFATLFFLRKREKEQEERVETMHMFGGAMAHEVKSPLATMDMYAGHLGSLLEEATNNKQKQGDFYFLKIKETELEMILDAGKTLKKISSHGITTVDTLLASMKSSVISDDKKELFMNEFIDLAISEYELLKQKQDGIKIIIIDNFHFYGSMYFMKQMLFNLLNNSYKYGGKNVKINIRVENNKLYFRDDGKGIAEEDIPYIFDKFYTKSKSGTGIGLAFCKMVMQDLGGYIECKSKLGKYTEFILTFPKLKKKKKLTRK
ncbi:putative periplasmic sensor histidine kinase [endosymbiont of Acanthamoeba sp. UWC8]|uniref:sodium:solute symporter family transporter n=1 Tax=endosymbiont of Acanthamoeba sp. UWC8 TaxID=86106 RepID=UPI0004D0FA13|nr:ATP-binding protein [endosymbiont of Acanthamoeba sp. UWC8]AIF81448.1 putative periplasmic sensor histidine kinase [endosymbiont of Acanthamoeba sp. UWC8]